jgi:hypothetical protein
VAAKGTLHNGRHKLGGWLELMAATVAAGASQGSGTAVALLALQR